MPDVADVRARALSAYEHGRLTAASRAALVVVPLAALCAWTTDAPARCAAAGFALLAVAILVRWRQYRGVQAVDAGMLTGIIPMTAAVFLCRFAASWPGDAALAVCAAAGFVAGGLAGRATFASGEAAQTTAIAASVVAGLTAALGCVGIGLGTAAGAAAGVALGAGVAARMPVPSAH
jgi:hypothetical protein